ncbi:MAG: hypothetical protein L3J65_01100 [Robiginitomaculum sp.]|nr:hypothetical protein [Robiginitomaculum sp.]
MPKPILRELLEKILAASHLDDGDVLNVRRTVFEDGHITVQEADMLFQINHLPGKPDTWFDLFLEGITHFLVRQTMPHGYINQANAAWLMARIDHDGVVETRTELELLMYVMKIANNVTDELEIYALNQVKIAVLEGRGFLAQGRQLQPGVIGEAEVDILRRVLYACSSEGGVGISKAEAEALFDINDAVVDADNSDSWQRLFVGAIANHLMMLAAWEEPDMAETLRRERWLEQKGQGFVVPSFKGFGDAVKSLFSNPEYEYSHTNKAGIADAERVTQSEAYWLVERLNRNSSLDANEKALLKFLREESPEIHESLMPYVNAA